MGPQAPHEQEGHSEAAAGLVMAARRLNQTACSGTRVVDVESEDENASFNRVIEFGEQLYQVMQALPTHL